MTWLPSGLENADLCALPWAAVGSREVEKQREPEQSGERREPSCRMDSRRAPKSERVSVADYGSVGCHRLRAFGASPDSRQQSAEVEETIVRTDDRTEVGMIACYASRP
jgi:hypothetical protein